MTESLLMANWQQYQLQSWALLGEWFSAAGMPALHLQYEQWDALLSLSTWWRVFFLLFCYIWCSGCWFSYFSGL